MIYRRPEAFDEPSWKAIAEVVRPAGRAWWALHKDALVGVARDELRAVAEALREGDRTRARYEVVARMDRATWEAYRDGTTAELRGEAAKRAKLLRALNSLGWFAARAIGKAALSAI